MYGKNDSIKTFCRLIRLSSPNLNYLIGLGAIIFYINVITLVVPTTNTDFAAVLCNVSAMFFNVSEAHNTSTCLSKSDQSLANISRLLFLLWNYHHQDDPSLGHFQQSTQTKGCKFKSTCSSRTTSPGAFQHFLLYCRFLWYFCAYYFATLKPLYSVLT